jgi:hypothetical protein
MNMPHWRVLVGFAFSIFVGDVVVRAVVRALWTYLSRHSGVPAEPHLKQSGSLSMPIGILERGLYTGALIFGAWQLVGAWLGLKTAMKWREVSKYRGADNIWLIGTGLSLLFGIAGAAIALGHVPIIR